ncbi:MAG: hypothetical protein ACTS10_12390 [Kiloniellales bacterium]
MNSIELTTVIIAWLGPIIFGFLVFLARHSITSWINSKIKIQTDKEIEVFRNQIIEEKEKIKTLQNHILSGHSNRQSIIENRRIEAATKIWKSINDLAPYRRCAEFLQSINIDVAAEHAPSDSKIRTFFELLEKSAGLSNADSIYPATDELFVSPKTWAFYRAYQTIAVNSFFIISALKTGLDPRKLINFDEICMLAKKTLPHQAAFIDQHGPSSVYFLLDEIKDKLLVQLRSEIGGIDNDQEKLKYATEIIRSADAASKSLNKRDLSASIKVPESIESEIHLQ